MKKFIAYFLLLFASQLHSYQPKEDDIFFFSDVLIWKLREGSADNWGQEISPAGIERTVQVLGIPFKWSPGLRLGVGYRPCSDWDTVFSYTAFRTKATSQRTATSGGIFSSFLGNFFINNTDGAGLSGPTYQSAHINWKVLYNIADIEAGRSFLIDEFLKLRPFIGLKGGSIHHNIQSTWLNPTTPTTFSSATETIKNNFWGIGPSLGLNSTWSIYATQNSTFSLFGNFSGAVMWGHWCFKDLYTNNTPTSVAVHINPVNGAATMARGFLGIEWMGCVSKTELAIRLGYEAQVWFNQIQYYSFNMGRLNNLLSLQGGVLSFEFNF